MEYQINNMNIEPLDHAKNVSSNRSKFISVISAISNRSSTSVNALEEPELAWPDPNHVYRPTGPFDLRCAYPEINALANHSYINHSGRGITLDSLINSIINVYGLNYCIGHEERNTDMDMDWDEIRAPIIDDTPSDLTECHCGQMRKFNLWDSEALRDAMKIFMPKNYEAHLTRLNSPVDPLRNTRIKDAYLKPTEIEKSRYCDCFSKWAWRRIPRNVSRDDFYRVLKETNPRRDDDYHCTHRDVNFKIGVPRST